MNTNNVLIKVEALEKTFDKIEVLKGIDSEIKKGEVVCIIGPSGSGKSTFLRCLNLLEEPTGGKIYFNGVDITDPKTNINLHRQKMGMVFQHFNLFPHMTVIENIMAAPMDLLGISKQEAYDKGIELLRKVGLADKALNYPDMMSGGQKQRLCIARALLKKPKKLLDKSRFP